MLASFVQETANAPGTAATITLGGASTGRVGFAAAFASGATCFYALDDGTQGEWGIGTVTHGSPVTLARTTVLGNTAGTTTRLNFTTITRVYATLPAERAVWRDASNNVTLPGSTLALSPIASGAVHLNAGSANNPGYVAFFSADNTRRGYIGWGDGTNNLLLAGDNGWGWKITASVDFAVAPTLLGSPLGVPAGAIGHFAMASAPPGWLKANGAALSRTTYAALFSAIGTTYGTGDGSTTFNLPDLRGEFLRVWDDGRGVDTGRSIGSSQAAQFAAHNHETGQPDTGGGSYFGTRAPTNATSTPINRDSLVGGLVNSNTYITSTAGGTETRPRNIALLACIKF